MNLFDIKLTASIVDIIFTIVIIAFALFICKAFDLLESKTILLMFVLITTIFYFFEAISIIILIISYLIFALVIYSEIRKSQQVDE